VKVTGNVWKVINNGIVVVSYRHVEAVPEDGAVKASISELDKRRR